MNWKARVAVRFMVPKPLAGTVSKDERQLLDTHLLPYLDFLYTIPSLIERAFCKLPQTRRVR